MRRRKLPIYSPPTDCIPLLMPLTRRQSRAFVLALLAVMLGLAVLATVVITNGWQNEDLQEHLQTLDED